MRLHFPLSAFLASTLIAASSGIDEAFLGNLAEGEIHVFKRDATITPRDVELAERDGVDLGQMYRHSMIKRDDGDHVTIWLHNSYVEHEQEESEADADGSSVELTKRQSYRITSTGSWDGDRRNRECLLDRTTYTGDTGPNAPYTGGANAIIGWSNNCRGGWRVSTTYRRDLIVAGSNSGFNMRFTVAGTRNIDLSVTANMGCRDVGVITRNARDRFQRQRNGWRVRARGQAQCEVVGTACFRGNCQPSFGSQYIDWWIDTYSGRV